MRNKKAKSIRRRARNIATERFGYFNVGGTRKLVPGCVKWWANKLKKGVTV